MDDDKSTAFSSIAIPLTKLLPTRLLWLSRALFVITLSIGVAFAYLYIQSSRLATLENDVEQLQAEALRLHKQAVVNRFESIDQPSKISIVFRQRLLQLGSHAVSGELQVALHRLMLQGSQYAEQLDVALMSHDAFSNIASTLIAAQQDNEDPMLESLYQQLTLDLLSLLSQEQISNDMALEPLNRSLLSVDFQQQQLTPERQAQAQFVIRSILPMLSRYMQYLQAIHDIHLTPFDETYNKVLFQIKEVRSQYAQGQLVLFAVLVIFLTLTTLLPAFFQVAPKKLLSHLPIPEAKESVAVNNEVPLNTAQLRSTTTEAAPNTNATQEQVAPLKGQPSHQVAIQPAVEQETPSVSSPVSTTELFDVSHILHCMDDDLDSVLMLLEIFVQEHNSDDIHFMDALEQGRLEDAARIVHSLKGVAGSIGSNALKNIAERLEIAIKQEDMIVEGDSIELGTILNDVVKTVQDYLETQGITVVIKKHKSEKIAVKDSLSDATVNESIDASDPLTKGEHFTAEAKQTGKKADSTPNVRVLIDIKYMMTTMDDDIDSVKMLLAIFVEEHVNDGKKLLQQVHGVSEIPEEAIRIVHSIKGVSSSLGANPLKVLAGNIEARFKQGLVVSDADYRAFDTCLTDTLSAATYYLEAENLAVYEEGVA